jgi:hypothetical protein
VYQTCLHCHGPLGQNEIIEHFSVGRRLAFDSAKGRLWVVCQKCRRWNLTPLEERWEAIEECEREFSRTRLHVATDNIALARVPEGLDLVRVGAPRFSEFAAWRYGKSLRQRWKTRGLPWAVLGVSGYAIQATISAGLLPLVPGMGLFALLGVPATINAWRQSRVRLMLPDGRIVTIRHRAPDAAELEPDGENAWAVRLTAGGKSERATGTAAVHTLRGLLTTVNFFGARKAQIDDAITVLQRAGDSDRYIRRVAQVGLETGASNVNFLPPEVRLALEMALHENAERRALEGELTGLRDEWRLAEDIAKIADEMFVPPTILHGLQRLKGASDSR